MLKATGVRTVIASDHDPAEFRRSLTMTAGGDVGPSPLLTGTVGPDGVAIAFEQLADPDRHAKILIDPSSASTSA